MKSLKIRIGIAIFGGILAVSSIVLAADQGKSADAKKAKAYPLKTCIVSDEKFGGDMGEPYVFVHQGQEIKLCCKSCLKDFNKEPAKYVKKLAEAEKRGKAKAPVKSSPAHGHNDHAGHQH